jgi:hypothetical protein
MAVMGRHPKPVTIAVVTLRKKQLAPFVLATCTGGERLSCSITSLTRASSTGGMAS